MNPPDTEGTVMRSPFATDTRVEVEKATERQLSYLRDIMTQKAQLTGISPEASAKMLDEWLPTLTKAGASKNIDEQRRQVDELKALQTESLEGIWVDVATNIYKVQKAVHGSGQEYAKKLDRESGKFEFESGLITRLRNGIHAGDVRKMVASEAADYGHLYGRCIVCGRTLTDEDSIERGIGPVCLAAFG